MSPNSTWFPENAYRGSAHQIQFEIGEGTSFLTDPSWRVLPRWGWDGGHDALGRGVGSVALHHGIDSQRIVPTYQPTATITNLTVSWIEKA